MIEQLAVVPALLALLGLNVHLQHVMHVKKRPMTTQEGGKKTFNCRSVLKKKGEIKSQYVNMGVSIQHGSEPLGQVVIVTVS